MQLGAVHSLVDNGGGRVVSKACLRTGHSTEGGESTLCEENPEGFAERRNEQF
jgi:hypothetical protein